MENTPMLCADDLLTILSIFKNDLKSRSVHNSFQQLDFDPDSIKETISSQSSAQTRQLIVQGAWVHQDAVSRLLKH